MRVLVVCPSYHGYDVAIGRAIEAIGHEVVTLGYFPHSAFVDKVRNRITADVLPRLGYSGSLERRDAEFNAGVLTRTRSHRAEVVVVVKGDVLMPETVEVLAKDAELLQWAFDDPYRYPNVVATLSLYSAIGAFAESDAKQLVADGHQGFHLPDGFDSFTFGATAKCAPATWCKEASFVGARYPEREALLGRVDEMADLGIWGGDWKRRPWRARYYQRRTSLDRACMGWAGPVEADLIYRSCAVNLNFHGDWDGLNMRAFEIPGAGGFQLCDERSDLADAFEPDREVAVYCDGEDLVEKVRYYLSRPEERGRIAVEGHRRAHAEHTLVHRMRTLLGRLVGAN